MFLFKGFNVNVNALIKFKSLSCGLATVIALMSTQGALTAKEITKPLNILFAISDDQSWPHTSVENPRSFVQTPNLARITKEGTWFTSAYAASPGCSPSRAALLTGRHHWMIGPAGTHASSFPAHYTTYVQLLEQFGYNIGYTGKGWEPGSWIAGGRTRNPAGIAYNEVKASNVAKGIHPIDYAENFKEFLQQRKPDEPFYFWYGAYEPHLPYSEGAHSKNKQAEVVVPSFLPDTEATRTTLLDYAAEISHFDNHLGKMISMLEEAGELENTLIIVTSDNGMPFPRAKGNGYDYGIHVPLAIRMPKAQAQVINIPVGFVDLSATILDAAKISIPNNFVGDSLLDALKGNIEVLDANRAVYSGRERHGSAHYQNASNPQRAMRRGDYLLIWNARPDLPPSGASEELIDGKLGKRHQAYFDIDDSVVKREYLANYQDPNIKPFFELAMDNRPEWQLYNVIDDPDNLKNLISEPTLQEVTITLKKQLLDTLKKTGDPRANDHGYVWDNYPRLIQPVRQFPKEN